jgi:cytochrome bd-type quinol oxidase subunit 1
MGVFNTKHANGRPKEYALLLGVGAALLLILGIPIAMTFSGYSNAVGDFVFMLLRFFGRFICPILVFVFLWLAIRELMYAKNEDDAFDRAANKRSAVVLFILAAVCLILAVVMWLI